MTSKPNETDSQTNIYIEVVNRIYGKTKSMLDWPLYTPSPNRECLYKVASPGKTIETESMLDWPLYTPSPNRECLYKVASPGKTPEKNRIYVGLATLYPLPQQRMPLQSGQSR